MLDYLIVGAGLAGAVFASVMTEKGCHCMVLDGERDPAGKAGRISFYFPCADVNLCGGPQIP